MFESFRGESPGGKGPGRKGSGRQKFTGWKGWFANLAGMLSAVGIALGGLFLVQDGLAREKESLLQGSGLVGITVQAEPAAAAEMEVVQNSPVNLTEEDLIRVVRDMESGGEIYPHEPGQDQLSMSQAITCGREWIETFFMPYMGKTDYRMEEYKADCFLWSLREKEGEEEKDPIFSYWTINFEVQGLAEVGLTLNAASGQVLIASIGLYGPVEYQDGQNLLALLREYAFSFGTDEVASYSFVESVAEGMGRTGEKIYHTISSQGLYAGIRTSSVSISMATENPGVAESIDIFTVRLYLTTDVDDYPW